MIDYLYHCVIKPHLPHCTECNEPYVRGGDTTWYCPKCFKPLCPKCRSVFVGRTMEGRWFCKVCVEVF